MNEKNDIQKAIDQIGQEGVTRYLPRGMKLHNCEMHGLYLQHYKNQEPCCPICAMSPATTGNGTTATEVEHYINLKEQEKACQFTGAPIMVIGV